MRDIRLRAGRNVWRNTTIVVVALLGLLAVGMIGGPGAGAAGDAGKKVDFNKDVRPILQASCVRCHGQDARNPRKRPSGGLRLDDKDAAMNGGRSGQAIVPGNAAESLLYKLLQGPASVDGRHIDAMPKAMMGRPYQPLATEKVDTIKRWIDQGAEWGK